MRAPQGAPVSSGAGKANLVQFTTREISLSSGGNINPPLEAALWLQPLPKHTRCFLSLSAPQQISSHWPTATNSLLKP
ncbi:ash family protein [Leminorella grimontii]